VLKGVLRACEKRPVPSERIEEIVSAIEHFFRHRGDSEVSTLAVGEQIMEQLQAKGGRLPFHDNSLPEEIRENFGMSKKAFKQAIGALFRERRIYIEPDGIRLVGPDEKT
jgi:predicted RNA-binding protein (virulence factor B family)